MIARPGANAAVRPGFSPDEVEVADLLEAIYPATHPDPDHEHAAWSRHMHRLENP